MKKPRRRIPRRVPGVSPGTIVVPSGSAPTTLRITEFDADSHRVREGVGLEQVVRALEDPRTSWLEVEGFGDADLLRGLARLLGMSDLVLEDVVNTPQRPMIHHGEAGTYVLLRSPAAQDAGDLRQISMWATRTMVATFVDQASDCFQPLHARLQAAESNLRRRGHDYLVFRLVDLLVDAYFPHLELLADRLDRIEAEVDVRPSAAPFKELHEIRRRLRSLHRAAVPQRLVAATMSRNEDAFFEEQNLPFLQDVAEHAAQVVDLTEHYHGIASDVHDLIQSSLNLRLNDVTRLLTVIATIFIPMHFIVGLYGMNFDTSSPWNMPELRWRYGYPAVLLLLACAALATVIWVRRKGLTKYTDDG